MPVCWIGKKNKSKPQQHHCQEEISEKNVNFYINFYINFDITRNLETNMAQG
jgi:hypothetical protein